ncbi:MAG: N-6 DNA methylase [candidate division Zixibacteria bacterium]|nr:N-6 DNA methylase [candidate division Zixibacteria bacterium]
MKLKSSIFPYKPQFPEQLADYHDQASLAIEQKKHHDQKRSLFMNFLRVAFDIEAGEVEIEEKIRAAHVRGYIDALYKWVIFEFKTDIEKERPAAELELKKYFSAQSKPAEYLALLTDGLRFEVFQYEDSKVRPISKFRIDKDDPLATFRFFDNILFIAKKVPPKSIDITTRFGLQSAVYNKSRLALHEMYDAVRRSPSVKVKFDEWNSLLSTVYGECIGDESLFIRHTYLALLSRLMVSIAIFPDQKRKSEFYRGVMTGSFFRRNNLPNLAEPDFFSWAIDTDVENDFLGLLSSIETYLGPYDFSGISEDLLKEIYQELVDPESRHSLGEYYTPDWIADLALDTINYKSGRILDPACGSGSFLLAAIRRIRTQGLRGRKLIEAVSENIIGIDVHPLAVIMTKANILLTLTRELRGFPEAIYLPVYMADSLMVSENGDTETIQVQASGDEAFHIPFDTIKRGACLDEIIDKLVKTSHRFHQDQHTRAKAWKGLADTVFSEFPSREAWFWRRNFMFLCKLVAEGKDTVWGFILKNAARPAFIRNQKVDYVVGNPPWLAYRYIKDKNYRARVKKLTLLNELLDNDNVKLFTQLDTSTLFFVYSEKHFLKEGGTIAFVLPKTTILPAKQHANFQDRGVSEIHDFTGVSPLFNVRSVLVVRRAGDCRIDAIPYWLYEGTLPSKNMIWEKAAPHLKVVEQIYDFLPTDGKRSYYYPHFIQGATLVPRCFWFVQPDKEASASKTAPYVETGEAAFDEAKKEWQLNIRGRIEGKFLFETVLAKGILPFGILRTEPLFLPLQKAKDSVSMADSGRLIELGATGAATWMQETEKLWQKGSQSIERSLIQRLNYNQTLTRQNIGAPIVVLYNTSGTHIAAALYIRAEVTKGVLPSHGFIADAKSYYYYPESIDEGDYLAAILNSQIVNIAIKEFQPQGLFGERDIHRRPFEVCAIPKFNPKDPAHRKLSALGANCRNDIRPFMEQFSGGIGRVRSAVRDILKNEIAKIDALVVDLLKAEGQTLKTVPRKKRKAAGNHDLFSL